MARKSDAEILLRAKGDFKTLQKQLDALLKKITKVKDKIKEGGGIEIDLEADEAISELDQLKNRLDKVQAELDQVKKKGGAAFNSAAASAKKFGTALNFAKLAITAIVGSQLVGWLRNISQEALKVTARFQSMELRTEAIVGGAEESKAALEELRQVADTVGLSYINIADSFSRFAAAAKDTALEGQGAVEVFKAVSIAAAGAGASGENLRGIMLALEQIMSKGKVGLPLAA